MEPMDELVDYRAHDFAEDCDCDDCDPGFYDTDGFYLAIADMADRQIEGKLAE